MNTLFSFLEIVASVLGIMATYLYIRGKYSGFMVGVSCTCLSILICFHYATYANSLIHVYFTVMNLIGWITWRRSEKAEKKAHYIPYSYSNRREIFLFVFLFVISFILLFLGLRFVNSPVVVLDALMTAVSFTAMFMSVRKKVDAWLIWIFSDILGVFLFLKQEAYFFSVLYVIYIGMGIWGWYVWHFIFYKKENKSV